MIGLDLAVGITCAAGAAACFDGALAWQALEARRVPVDDRRLLLRLVRRPRWLVATGLAALGWPLQIAALSTAPLTVVQPALAFGLVLLLALGRVVLREHVGRVEIGGALAIIAGVAVLAAEAPERHTSVSHPAALAVSLAVLAALAVAPLVARTPGQVTTLAAGAAFACTGLTSKLTADALARGDAAAAIGWAAATGAVVLAGVNADMAAMQRLPATRVAPVILAIEVVVPVALAPVVAGEAWNAGVALGVLLVTAGVVPLASAPAVRALERGG